jgi:virginiamycin B lyase
LPSAITVFPVPANNGISDLTVGPDGNLWFGTYANEVEIGRITPAGALTAFPLPAGYDFPPSLTVGPDGNLWFTESILPLAGSVIGRMTLSGALTAFPLPAGYGFSGSLTVGSDGNLWFPENSNNSTSPNKIGRITPAGSITEFSLPSDYSFGSIYTSDVALTVGPDGDLWFIEYAASRPAIGRITPAGAITDFPLPAVYGTLAGALTAGPDGDLWFTEYAASGPAIGRITPAGAITDFPLPAGNSPPENLTVGPDGDLWFTEYSTQSGGSAIGRITPAGGITVFALPTNSSFVPGGGYAALTVGPDGNLWFTETLHHSVHQAAGYAIARITPAGAITDFRLPADHNGLGPASALTVGPDGDLWFSGSFDASVSERIYRIDPTPPSVTGALAVAHSRKGITAILVSFDEALDPRSVREAGFYGLAVGVASGPMIVFNRGVKIARVSYDRAAHAVRLKLAAAQKGPVQVTVRAGLVAADGIPSTSDFTAVVQ